MDTDKSIHLAVVSFTTLLRAIVLIKFFFVCVSVFLFLFFSFFFLILAFLPPRAMHKLRRD